MAQPETEDLLSQVEMTCLVPKEKQQIVARAPLGYKYEENKGLHVLYHLYEHQGNQDDISYNISCYISHGITEKQRVMTTKVGVEGVDKS